MGKGHWSSTSTGDLCFLAVGGCWGWGGIGQERGGLGLRGCETWQWLPRPDPTPCPRPGSPILHWQLALILHWQNNQQRLKERARAFLGILQNAAIDILLLLLLQETGSSGWDCAICVTWAAVSPQPSLCTAAKQGYCESKKAYDLSFKEDIKDASQPAQALGCA